MRAANCGYRRSDFVERVEADTNTNSGTLNHQEGARTKKYPDELEGKRRFESGDVANSLGRMKNDNACASAMMSGEARLRTSSSWWQYVCE